MSKEMVKQKTPEIMEWVLDNGEQLQFTLDDAKNISGNPNVTAKEFYMLCKICAPSKLNPFLKDAFLIKYGNSPAQIITGKNSAMKVASRNKNYNGFKAGIIVIDKTNKVIHREGAMIYDGEQLVGGWGKVFKKDQSEPAYNEVSLKEYIGKTKDGSTNKQWREKPATMIRKVGLVQPLREAFPEDLNGVYDESEVAAIENTQKGENPTANSKVANIFGKKDDDIIEGEIVDSEEKADGKLNESQELTSELHHYINVLNVPGETINMWYEKVNAKCLEELPDAYKQKLIDYLKPKYEALQKTDKTKEALQQTDMLADDAEEQGFALDK